MSEINLYPTLSLDEMPTCTPASDGSCAICADEGIVGRVLELQPNNMALLSMPGGPQEVAIDLVEGVRVGDQLLVHVGFAIAHLGVEA